MIWLWVIGYLVAGCIVAAAIAFIDGITDETFGLSSTFEDRIPFIVLFWPVTSIALIFGMFGKLLVGALTEVHDWACERFRKK